MLPSLLLALGLGACDVTDPRDPDGPDAGPVGPITDIAYGGDYAAVAHWDVSAAFGADSIANMIADAVVDQIVALAGVPGPLEGEARDLVADAVHAPVRDYVAGQIPADLAPGSGPIAALAEAFSDVEVASQITLTADAADSDRFTGVEVVEAVTVRGGGADLAIPVADLSEGGIDISAPLSGSAIGASRISIGDRELALGFRALVVEAAARLGLPDLEALGAQAAAAIACPDVVAIVTGGDGGFDISVGGETFTVESSALEPACVAIRDEITARVLGVFSRETGVGLGGPVTLTDVSGGHNGGLDGADQTGALTSVAIVTPTFPAPFAATRQ